MNIIYLRSYFILHNKFRNVKRLTKTDNDVAFSTSDFQKSHFLFHKIVS